MKDKSDEKLITLYRSGEADAGVELINRYAKDISKIANAYFLVGAEPEDLRQYGAIGLLKAIAGYKGVEPFSHYARICIRNEIFSEIKKSVRDIGVIKYFSEQLVEVDDPLERVIDRDAAEKIRKIINEECTSLEREVFELYLQGYGYAEIGDRLNKSAKAADNAIQRVRKKVIDGSAKCHI